MTQSTNPEPEVIIRQGGYRVASPQSTYDRSRMRTGSVAALNVRCLHPNMRRLFKVWCAKRDISMEQAVVQLIQGVVSGDITFAPDSVGHIS